MRQRLLQLGKPFSNPRWTKHRTRRRFRFRNSFSRSLFHPCHRSKTDLPLGKDTRLRNRLTPRRRIPREPNGEVVHWWWSTRSVPFELGAKGVTQRRFHLGGNLLTPCLSRLIYSVVVSRHEWTMNRSLCSSTTVILTTTSRRGEPFFQETDPRSPLSLGIREQTSSDFILETE